MKKNFILMCAAVCTIAVVSCKKDSDSNTNTNITGTWNFKTLHIETETSSETTFGTDVFKSVATSNYNTTANSGAVVIDASNFTGKNMTYSYNTRAYTTMYENGVSTDTSSFPYSGTLAPYTSTAAYTRVNNDSIYFPHGATFIGGFTGASEPSGARVSISGNQLTMTQSQAKTSLDSASGAITHIKASIIATFQK